MPTPFTAAVPLATARRPTVSGPSCCTECSGDCMHATFTVGLDLSGDRDRPRLGKDCSGCACVGRVLYEDASDVQAEVPLRSIPDSRTMEPEYVVSDFNEAADVLRNIGGGGLDATLRAAPRLTSEAAMLPPAAWRPEFSGSSCCISCSGADVDVNLTVIARFSADRDVALPVIDAVIVRFPGDRDRLRAGLGLRPILRVDSSRLTAGEQERVLESEMGLQSADMEEVSKAGSGSNSASEGRFPFGDKTMRDAGDRDRQVDPLCMACVMMAECGGVAALGRVEDGGVAGICASMKEGPPSQGPLVVGELPSQCGTVTAYSTSLVKLPLAASESFRI
mmetsp:Transcript_84581/g.146757  ORF Transcript_84581/g.146757 Transcript_84581/m.146757 type:complete len:336 (+) Transcript_84581:424-1431(+)